MKKFRVLFLLHIPPPVHGSSIVGQYIKDSPLVNKSFQCGYVNLLASKTISESGDINLRKIAGLVKIFLKLFLELTFKRPKFVYLALTTTGAAFYRDILIIALLRLYGVKRIYHLHNKGIKKNQTKFLHRSLYRFVFRKSKVILLSPNLYNDISDIVVEDNVYYCPNGIPDVTKPEDINAGRYKSQLICKVLFLSNLIESKGIFDLLDATAILVKKGIQFNCELIGGEGDIKKDALEKKILEMGLAGYVSYLGPKYGYDKYCHFLNTDIFVFPTYYDCFPLVLIEAMQYGLPIVTCPEGGIPDIVREGETGYLVLQRDIISLSDKLELLLNNRELRDNMGKLARQRYNEEYTIEIFEQRIFQILSSFVTN